MRTIQRAVMAFAGIAVLAFVVGAVPAAGSQEQPQRPPQDQPQRQPAPIQGDLVKVDTEAKTLTIKVADSSEQQFQYNDSTEITGAKGAAGLATMKEGRVTVHFTENAQTKAKLATRIIVEPPKK